MMRLFFQNLIVRYLTWRNRERLLGHQMREVYKTKVIR
jgi:hypothetical protein